jgi:hypothetical protein
MSRETIPQKTHNALPSYFSSYSLEALLALKKVIDSEVEARKNDEADARHAGTVTGTQAGGVPVRDLFVQQEAVAPASAIRRGFRRFRTILAEQVVDSACGTGGSPPPAGSTFAPKPLTACRWDS